MIPLIPNAQAAQKADPGPADRRLEARREAAANASRRRLFGRAASAEPSAPISLAPVAHLSSFMSGADTMPRLAPEAAAKRTAPAPLHPIAAKLRQRFGDDVATLISEVAKKNDAAGGAACDFDSKDAGVVLGVPEPRARAIMDVLLTAGVLIARRSPFGGRAGYIVADPTA